MHVIQSQNQNSDSLYVVLCLKKQLRTTRHFITAMQITVKTKQQNTREDLYYLYPPCLLVYTKLFFKEIIYLFLKFF